MGLWCWYPRGRRGEAVCYRLLAAIRDKGAQPQPVTFFPSPKTQPKVHSSLQPKVHSSLQPTSQQPSPGTRLCFLIKSKSGRDKQQQQSPRGNHTLSPPRSNCPGFFGYFIPIACHRLCPTTDQQPSSVAAPQIQLQAQQSITNLRSIFHLVLSQEALHWALLHPTPIN